MSTKSPNQFYLDNVVYRSELLQKEEAQEKFSDSIASDSSAILVEKTGSLFTISIGIIFFFLLGNTKYYI